MQMRLEDAKNKRDRRNIAASFAHLALEKQGSDTKGSGSIMDSFSKTFQPFLQDTKYASDGHHVTSEVGARVTDYLKRYQVAQTPLPQYTNSTSLGAYFYPGIYTPAIDSIGYALQSVFAFQRGGVKYKIVPNPGETSPATGPETTGISWGPSYNAAYASGNAGLAFNYPSVGELSFAIPWIGNVPFIAAVQPGTYTSDNGTRTPAGAATTQLLAGVEATYVYTAVRDDFTLGFLCPTYVIT